MNIHSFISSSLQEPEPFLVAPRSEISPPVPHAQVGDGTTSFIPSPEDGRRLVAGSYSVPRTLLIRFEPGLVSVDECLPCEPLT